jgi:hypothetical protein
VVDFNRCSGDYEALVEPMANRTVTGRLVIDERFAPGATYDTRIRVAGFPGREVAITLVVGERVSAETKQAPTPA